MDSKFVASLLEAEDPERIKKLIKKLDEKADGAVLATIELGESELLKLHSQIKQDANSLTEESILTLRKALIAVQFFSRQMIGAEAMSQNLERLVLNLVLPLLSMCGPFNTQPAITLKIDAISMYGKLLQAFEDMAIPYSSAILDSIVGQLDHHSKLLTGESTMDPFEAMVVKELYAELITQSVDVCGSMVLIAPEKLSEKAQLLFEHTAVTLRNVKDVNCRYELVELIAQLCMLGLKSGEEQTPEEDFLDFEMRKIQAADTASQQHKTAPSSSSTTSMSTEHFTSKMLAPLWNAKSLPFESLLSVLTDCVDMFSKEEYEQEDDYEEESEQDEDEDGEEPKEQTAPKSEAQPGDTTSPTFEPTAEHAKKDDSHHNNSRDNAEGHVVKRRQDESGTATAIALLSGLSFSYMTAEQHAQCFELVHTALMSKIAAAFSSSESYAKLPAMLDALAQFISSSAPAQVTPHYVALTTLLEDIMKAVRIWRSEDASPLRRRVYSALRAELLPCYSALLRQDPESTFAHIDHFMTATTFLLADPMIIADCACALVTIKDAQKLDAAKNKLLDGLLFKMIDSYLRELSNPETSVGMKKTVMQSIGKIAIGIESLFASMLEITVPVVLFIGRQVPDLAPSAITSVAQILYGVRHSEQAAQWLQKGIDYAIAMLFQFITMSGMELSSETQKTNSAAMEVEFNFSTKERLEDEESAEDEEEEMIQDDNLADLVYKGECFLMCVLHVPELLNMFTALEGAPGLERIFNVLLELEEKPSLFEEDSMLKMTAVDIIVYMVEKIPLLHSKVHRDKAVTILKDAEIEHFENELEEAIERLKHLSF